jgi:hypothetical protein
MEWKVITFEENDELPSTDSEYSESDESDILLLKILWNN